MLNFNYKYCLSLIIILAALSSYIFCQTIENKSENISYHLIRIHFDSSYSYKDFLKSGFDLEGINFNKSSVELALNDYELNGIKLKKIKYEILIDDYEKYIENKLNSSKQNIPLICSEKNFKIGSMGGSYKIEEVYAVFDSMRNKYPDYMANPEVIGYTIEDRPIMAYCFSSKNGLNKKEVLITALHHAREGGGLTTVVYFLWNLLEGIDSGNPESLFLLNNRKIWVIPVVNPDGVAFNESRSPNGGGFWRKNRRKINDTTYGVDLNRNYGPQQFWEVGNSSSATDPRYDTYRGESPFSEPETQSVRDFCMKHDFKIACNYHTFGGQIIFPWGALSSETSDSIWFRSFTEDVTFNNKYNFGRGIQTVGYEVSGVSDDWMYLATSGKEKIFSITPEVGSVIDGFWPLPERYIPIAKDNLYMNYQLLWSAGTNLRHVKSEYDYDSLNKTGVLTVTVKNIGIDDMTSSSSLIIKSLDSNVKIESPEKDILPLMSTETQTERFNIPYPYNFRNGSEVAFTCSIIQDGIERIDTFKLQLYRYTTVNIYKGGSLGSGWKNNNWNTFEDKTIGRKILTDSPGGNYTDMNSNYLIYDKPISITGINATLEFNTHWSLESNYDVVYIEASSDLGKTWNNLRASRMKMGVGLNYSRQDSGKYGFDGYQPDYIRQECDLSQFLNKSIIFRFGILSDNALNFDGIFMDDIKIRFYEDLTGVNEGKAGTENDYLSIECYPSPVKIGEPVSVFINSDENNESENVKITLYNSIGEKIYSSEDNLILNNKSVEISTKNMTEGFYYLQIEGRTKVYNRKIIAIR
ncbi:MAG: T9SS type A sorting domain-containing protein [Bacteroidetes bacterium]|nr:MAG: T9SS type A sorting domain-containing protein [Bacteroidota bacterium]